MVTRTFINKSNTILKNSDDNFGLNPIAMLSYGHNVCRAILQFDIEKIKALYNDGVYKNIDCMKHILHMTNCGSINGKDFNSIIMTSDSSLFRKRTNSFDIYALRINKPWDSGDGFDTSEINFSFGGVSISKNGSTWYNSKSGIKWDVDGIYDTDLIKNEISKFKNGEKSDIVIASQHFDYGNEDLEIDLTDFVNDLLTSTNRMNCGICLMFDPLLESITDKYDNYVGFFNEKTNTFFEPYIETRYTDTICDDRFNFKKGKKNRLYLPVYIDGSLTDLDELPICSIDGVSYDVVHQSKGIYYANVKPKCELGDVLYDEWSNIIYDGDEIDDIEMSAEVVGNALEFTPKEKRTIDVFSYGLKDDEQINTNTLKVINLGFRYAYTKDKCFNAVKPMYRVYILDGGREITVVDWDDISCINGEYIFSIDTGEFLPQSYYIDYKVKLDGVEHLFKKKNTFVVVNDITKRRH